MSEEERKLVDSVPYIVHESEIARSERTIRRLIIALVMAVILMFATNALWIYEWTQYDYVDTFESSQTVSIDGERGMANFIGNDGNINLGGDDLTNGGED